MTRKWKDGDVYAPHDLSGVEMSKWSKGQPKGRPKKDVFDMLKINPLNHYWVCFPSHKYTTDARLTLLEFLHDV
jgi:small subunit ribosomal protein S18